MCLAEFETVYCLLQVRGISANIADSAEEMIVVEDSLPAYYLQEGGSDTVGFRIRLTSRILTVCTPAPSLPS